MNLPPYSDEQYNVIKLLKDNNVMVDSVAGSGKTTCNLHIASYYNDKKILLLTYNAKLKIETRDKVNLLGIKNMVVHTYHSFCVRYYDNKCFTDTNITMLLKNNTIPSNTMGYDIIIIDEAQDITPLYYELVLKIYKDNMNGNVMICILGDRYQSIYDFNNADERYIVYAPILFNFNKMNWVTTNLSQSFRITKPMSEFINNCIMNRDHIMSNKNSNHKPRYIVCDTFGSSSFSKFIKFAKKPQSMTSIPFSELMYYLEMGYKPEDIFILAPSVKSDKSAIRQLENKIKTTLKNISIYIPVSDEEKLDKDVLKNKLVFSTFHQAKGLERKVVIIFNFDNSYFIYYKKDKNTNICPNEIYVAITRGLERLSIFHHYSYDYFPFLNTYKLNQYCEVIYDKKLRLSKIPVNMDKKIKVSVTDLIKHLPSTVLDECFNYIKITCIRPRSTIIDIPIKTDQKNGMESVSEITGTAIPTYFEYMIKNKKCSILEELNKVIENEDNGGFLDDDIQSNTVKNSDSYDISTLYKNIVTLKKTFSADMLLYIANKWCSYKSGFIFKTYQITNYDWLSDENLNKCIERLKTLNISNKALFEGKIEIKDTSELGNKHLIGYFDCNDGNKIYELKCVKELTKEHYLQVAIYMYINENTKKNININIGDTIKYIDTDMMIELEGKILRIFKNGNVDILNPLNKTIKIKNTDIIKNIKMEYYLYNILTDELNRIDIETDDIIKLVKYLIDSKYNKKNGKTDEVFINDNLIKLKI